MKTALNLLRFLSIFESGALSIRIDELFFFKIETEFRTIEVDASEMKDYGLRLSKLSELQTGQKGWIRTIKGTMTIAKELHSRGWALRLYDGKICIVTMGQGASRLTAYIRMSPFKIRRILKYL
jgi:aminopeptidase-like protein